MAEEVVDYGEDAKPEITENILARIDVLGNAFLDAEAEVDAKEAELKAAKEKLKDLAERQLPEAMELARQKDLTTLSNVKIKIEDKVRASLPKDELKRAKGIAWLRDKGHGAQIKTEINIPFEAGRDPAAQGLNHILVLLAVHEPLRKIVRDHIMMLSDADANVVEPAYSFLTAVGNSALSRFILESNVHHSSLAALVRELLAAGKIDAAGMEVLGAHAWKEASVKRKD